MRKKLACIIIVVLLSSLAASADELSGWHERLPLDTPQQLIYDVGGQSSSKFLAGQPDQKFVLRTTCVRQGKRMAIQTLRWDADEPQPGIRRIIDNWYLGYELPPYGKAAHEALYAADGLSHIGDLLPAALGTFDGFLEDDGPTSLQEIVKRADTRKLSIESISGIRCIRLEANNAEHGKYTLWLDPAADYLPRHLIVEKEPHHWWSGRRLEEWNNLKGRGSVGKLTCTHFRLELDNVVLDKVAGRWEAVSWRNRRTLAFSDGNEDRVVMSGQRVSATELTSVPADAFRPGLQDGAILQNLASPQIPFEWRNDEPKPWVNRSAVKAMGDAANEMRQAMSSMPPH